MSFAMDTKVPASFCCPSEKKASSHTRNSAHSKFHEKLSDSGLEAILVQGMNNLSFEELQREQEDLHGIVNTDKEMPDEEVDQLLEALDQHLGRIKGCTSYHLAESRDSTYVQNRDFRMIFLRGNRFNPKESAEQMIRFFALKHELFGEDLLCRDITAQDLTPEDTAHLLEGSVQLGCCRDRSDRRIAFEFPGLRSSCDLRSELRARFYISTKLSFTEDTRGVVIVSYSVGQYREHLEGKGYLESTRLALAIPGNMSGLHMCMDDLKDAVLSRASMAIVPSRMKAKTKLHYGSHQECQYLLAGYGIPREALPFTDPDSDIDLTYHYFWYQQCVQKEREQLHGSRPPTPLPRHHNGLESSVVSVVSPGDADVLCIGRRVQGSGGNDLLFSMVQFHAPSYHAGDLTHRRAIIDELIEQVRTNGGRFLKMDKANKSASLEQDRWVEVNEKESREKIQQMFRNLKRNRRGGGIRSGSVTTSSSLDGSITSTNMACHPPMVVVDQISEADVVVGKKNTHPGTLRLQSLIRSLALEYDEATRGEKKLLSDRVVRIVQEEHGGRFLRPLQDSRWEVISSFDAAQKISNHFRNSRRKQR